MIASMTGFGRGSTTADGLTTTVEMRSVNNRFIDVSVRLPRSLTDREADVQNRVKQAFERGRVSVQIQVEQDTADLPITVNVPVARAYGRLLDDLRRAAGIEAPVTLDHVLRYAEVFTTAEEDPARLEAAWDAVLLALDAAIAQMQAHRVQEGEALFADLLGRTDALEEALARVEARAPERIQEARERLQERLRDVLDDARVDADRLELEIALVADRLDVTEECVRLHAHLAMFRDALAAGEPVGRKLNFIVQEIHREVNTIGSKANDPDIAQEAVTMKEEVEKIREQVQNVE